MQNLINPIVQDEPDPSAANILQEGLGGQFGEMRTMMQYLFQSFNFRGNGTPYLDLIQGIGVEEISHVELITKTISTLLDGAPEYHGKKFQGHKIYLYIKDEAVVMAVAVVAVVTLWS